MILFCGTLVSLWIHCIGYVLIIGILLGFMKNFILRSLFLGLLLGLVWVVSIGLLGFSRSSILIIFLSGAATHKR